MAQTVKHLSATQETQVQSLGWEDPLEKGMAEHSSTLPWEIPWTEEPGGYSPWGRKESDGTAFTHNPTLVYYLMTLIVWTALRLSPWSSFLSLLGDLIISLGFKRHPHAADSHVCLLS